MVRIRSPIVSIFLLLILLFIGLTYAAPPVPNTATSQVRPPLDHLFPAIIFGLTVLALVVGIRHFSRRPSLSPRPAFAPRPLEDPGSSQPSGAVGYRAYLDPVHIAMRGLIGPIPYPLP